jgi:hypothetical protein
VGPVGVQPQVVTTANGTQVDPNALPIFPSPNASPSRDGPPNGSSDRASYSSDMVARPPPPVEKPKLTFAALEELRRDAKENPSDPAIQLEFAKALVEAGSVLAQEQGMGDPKRVAKSRENYISEAYKIIKKLSSSVDLLIGCLLIVGFYGSWETALS